MPLTFLMGHPCPDFGLVASVCQQRGARLAVALPAPHGGDHVGQQPPIIPADQPPQGNGGTPRASVTADMHRPIFQIADRKTKGLLYREHRVNKARGEPGVESRSRNG